MSEPSKETSVADQVQGTCLVVGAAMVFAVVALVVKVDPLPLLPATECRFFVSWLIASAFMLWFKESRGLHWWGPPGRPRRMLLMKSAVSFSFITLWWAALRTAPIGDCIAIIYSSPVLTSLFSLFLLGEKLPREFPIQVLLVSAGSLLVLDPPFLHGGASASDSGPHQDYTMVLLALVFCSLAPVVTFETRSCSWIEVEHVGAATACLVMDPALLGARYVFTGALPSMPSAAPLEILLIMLAAGGSFVGIAMETKGYQLAEPGKASMFRYVEIPFAYFLQHVGTGAPVTPQAAGGSVLIVAACFVSALAQRQTKATETAKGASTQPLLDGSAVEGA